MLLANKLVFERTAQLTVPADSTAIADQLITIPELSGVRPIAVEILAAAADFSVEIADTAAGTTGQMELVALSILPNTGSVLLELGPDSELALEAAATATTCDVRWLYPLGAISGIASTSSRELIKSAQTATLSAVVGEASVTVPAGAVGLVIDSLSATLDVDGLMYRVDDGTADGQQISLLQGEGHAVQGLASGTVTLSNDGAGSVDTLVVGGVDLMDSTPVAWSTDLATTAGLVVAEINGNTNHNYFASNVGAVITIAQLAPGKLTDTELLIASTATTIVTTDVGMTGSSSIVNKPYTINLRDDDRLRIIRVGSDATVNAHWLMA